MKTKVPILDQAPLSGKDGGKVRVERFAAYLSRNKNLIFPHRHSFYHFVLFTKGAGRHSIDFESYVVQEWQVYFMVPGQIHSWDFEGEMDGYIVNFEVDSFQTFLLRPDYIANFSFFPEYRVNPYLS